MNIRTMKSGVAAVSVALILAACGSSSSSSTSTTKADDEGGSKTTMTSAMGSQIKVTSPDDATEQAILAAIATYNKLTPADYTGLSEGSVYMAEDGSTGYQFAGAQPVPSSTSTAAQVASQDDGSYLIVEKAPGQDWTVTAATGGLAVCPADVPPANVVAAWGWTKGTCKPSSK
jgi:hypothetical protein